MKLDMGCGTFKKEGFLGVDPYVETDYKCPMWKVPLPDNSIDEIWTCHALEHVSKFDVIPTLNEWKRLIRPGCLITIEVPDLLWCVHNWAIRGSTDWFLDTIFGMQTHEGEFHRTGFTTDMLHNYIESTGLVVLHYETVESHGQPTLHFEVTKW